MRYCLSKTEGIWYWHWGETRSHFHSRRGGQIVGKWSDWDIFSTSSCKSCVFLHWENSLSSWGTGAKKFKTFAVLPWVWSWTIRLCQKGSKNHPGTFRQKQQSNKVVPLYSNPEAEPRCVIYLLDFYFSKFPQLASTMPFFYLKPLPTKPDNEAPWFQATPIGKNTLAKFAEKMWRCWDRKEDQSQS